MTPKVCWLNMASSPFRTPLNDRIPEKPGSEWHPREDRDEAGRERLCVGVPFRGHPACISLEQRQSSTA